MAATDLQLAHSAPKGEYMSSRFFCRACSIMTAPRRSSRSCHLLCVLHLGNRQDISSLNAPISHTEYETGRTTSAIRSAVQRSCSVPTSQRRSDRISVSLS